MQDTIDSFEGEFRFLSNFYPSEITFWHLTHGGMIAPTVEHAFAASKTENETDAVSIIHQDTPGRAKRLGRKVTIREDWDVVKVGVMYHLVSCKFHQNPDLHRQLVATGDAKLIEGNKWGDTFWGVCEGEGKNLLGHILESVRSGMR